jgi:hypothetical protein
MMKERVISRLRLMSTKDPAHAKKIDKIDEYFLNLLAPKNLDGMSVDNIIINTKKEFEKLCVILVDRGIPDPARMTVFRFYTTLKHYEESTKKSTTARRKK